MNNLEELVASAAEGDKSAITKIYEQKAKAVYFTCMVFLKNEHDAADVSQEVWITVMGSLKGLKNPSGFEAWLNRITVNKCKDFLKKKRPVPVDEETMEELKAEEEELLLPEEYITNQAKRKIVTDIMKETLSDTLYQTVVLYYFNNMSISEIAEIMECPEGTVGYRLSAARAKIKEGVLRYEKDNDDKLYSAAFVPVLAGILTAEMQSLKPQNVCAGIVGSAYENSAAGKAAETGVKTMFKTLKAKITAGVLAFVVIAAGIIAAVVIPGDSENNGTKKNDKPDKRVESTEDNGESSITQAPENGGSEGNNGDGGNEEGDNGEGNERDYSAMAEDMAAQIGDFLEALKAGDVDTVMSMALPDGEYYEYMEEIREYECTEEFLRIFYGDVSYTFNDEILEDMAGKLERCYENGDETVNAGVVYSAPYSMFFSWAYLGLFEAGDIVPEYPEANSNEEALALLKTIVAAAPKRKGTDFWVTIPDENGRIYVNLDYVLDDMMLDDIDRSLNEYYPVAYVNDICGASWTRRVGDDSVAFTEYNEAFVTAGKLFESKDFAGLQELICEYADEDIEAKFSERYGSYEELTAAQKEFVDTFVTEEISCRLIDFVAETGGEEHRSGIFIMTYPLLDSSDKELTDWYGENDIKKSDFLLTSVQKPEELDRLLYGWYEAIEYAGTFIE